MLKILGIVFLVLIVLFGGLLLWGFLKGSEIQEDFYEAVSSGDPDRVLGLMHDDLTKEIDRPVLAAWMAHFKERMGALKGLSKSNFSTKTENGVTTSKGKVEFEKGDVDSSLTLMDDKIVEFHVKSKNLEGPWLDSLADTTLYRERGKEYFDHLARGDFQAAFGMMHESLQTEMPLESLTSGMEGMKVKVGEMRSVTYDREEFTAGNPSTLEIYYSVECAERAAEGRVKFVFGNLRGDLIGFNIK